MIRYACEYDHSGYAVAARRYLRAGLGAGLDIRWEPLLNTIDGRLPVQIERVRTTAIHDLLPTTPWPAGALADATVAHSTPMTWGRLFDEFPARRHIGQTVWETETVPTRWIAELAPADELWVPTEWNARTLRSGGWTKPIHVVPHAVEECTPAPPPLDLPPDATVFTSISTWDWRKRPDLVVEAFLRAFTADDDVVLVLKTGERVLSWRTARPIERQTWWQVMEIVKRHRDPASVVLDTAHWTDAQISGLLQRTDAYVSLTATEGWGLGAFDAAAAGVPVVITGWGGQAEWLADAPFLIPYSMVPADHPDHSMFETGMTWASADVDAAAAMLREIHQDRAGARRASEATARRLRHDYSPAAIGALMKELLA